MTYSVVVDTYRDAFDNVIADMRAQQQRIATLLAGSGALLGFVSTLIPDASGVSRALSIATVCVLALVLSISGWAIWPTVVAAPELGLLSDYLNLSESDACARIVNATQAALANPATIHLKKRRDHFFFAALLCAGVALALLVLQAFTLPDSASSVGTNAPACCSRLAPAPTIVNSPPVSPNS